MFENSNTSYTTDSKTNFENTTSNFKLGSFGINNTNITNVGNDKISQPGLLNQEEIELKQICKLFDDLSLTQRKQFLANIIETFDDKLLNSLNFVLGSTNHKDFEYKFDSNRKPKVNKNVTINLNPIKVEASLKSKPTKLVKHSGRESKLPTPAKLPNIIETPKTNLNIISKRKRSNKRSLMNRGFNLDKFVLNKSLEIIDSPWSLKNYTVNKKININTENLIQKLKRLFRRQYQISSSSQFNRKSSKMESTIGTISSNDFFNMTTRQNSTIRSVSNDSINLNVKSRNHNQLSKTCANMTNIDLKSIYLKKLKNNYYDRKLWDTLVNSTKKLNINPYPDQSAREYNSEFNILKHHDWTMSSFAETVSKYAVKMPPINLKNSNETSITEQKKKLSFDMKRIGTATKFSKLQQNVLAENMDVRLKYFNSIMQFIPSIQKWSNLKKQNLLKLLFSSVSKETLEFLRDSVKKKIKPTETTIENLPDSVLLNIFSRLDMETLEKVELVCNRWNYLANTPELWIYKCKKLGEKENLGQIESLIANELSNDEDIDWKLAYTELTEFVKRLKQNYLDKFSEINSRQTNDTLKSASNANSKREVSFIRSTRNNSASSYVNFYTQDDEKSEPDVKDLFFDIDLSSDISEHLRALERKKSRYNIDGSLSMLNSENEKYNEREHLRFQKESNFMERRRIESKYFKAGPEFKGDFNQIVVKTELSPTKDLLNKVVPSYKLRWKLEDEDLRANETVIGTLRPITKVLSLNNHTAAITCIDYDKKRIVTGGLDRMIFVYDFKEGKCLGRLEGHKGGIRCLQILKNRLCSGSFDQTVIIWNMYHFEKVISIGYSNHQDSISCLYFDFDYLICGSHDTRINIWKFNQNYVEKFEKPTVPFVESDIISFDKMIFHHKSAVTALTYDGIKNIISANAEGLILIIDINGELLKELSFTSDIEPITCLKLVGSLILATTVKGKVLFWNRKDDSLETIIKCNNDYTVSVNSIAFQGTRFYTAGSDCLIKEWDLQSLTCLRQFVAHDGPVLDLIAVDNKIISCGADRAIIWDFNAPKPIDKKPKNKAF